MKKIVLSIAAVMAAAAFAPEASAVPVFARQTGMACSACHFQHFPLLNGFGRAFKSAGFTMMGAQGKIEGEHLSIPDTLNMSVLTSAYYQNEKNTGGAAAPKLGVPGSGGEFSLFIGGRISEFSGFLSEVAINGGANAGNTGLGAAKIALLFPVGDARVGFAAYTGGQGAAYGYEVLNTGAADTHKMMGNAGPNKQHVAATYAASYMGTRTNATGINLVANADFGFITLGKYADAAPGAGANTLPLTYARAAYIFDLAGWDSAVGIQNFSGSMAALNGALPSYKATIVDAQFQGEVGGMSTGVYVSYATAPGDINGNMMNAGWSPVTRAGNVPAGALTQGTSKSFNVAGSLELIPGIATLQGAIRRATNGNFVNTGDNAIMIGATYELAQNIEIGLNHTVNSGSAWSTLVNPAGKTSTTLLLESLF